MEFRTSVNFAPSEVKITYNDPVMFIGSCFATSIGRQFEAGRMPVMINPSGTVYNPFSVSNTLSIIIEKHIYSKEELFLFENKCISFDHYTEYSLEDPDLVVSAINRKSKEAFEFLSGARYLFITFGTARIFRWNESGKIVSNCHKIPDKYFTRELLTVNEIALEWNRILDKIHTIFPRLNIVFTISPVRHWKDGAHGNQVSKSVLFLAVEELLKHSCSPGYFPAYEILNDELRDYRFYENDMLHPSSSAIDYIWEKFKESYFEKETTKLWNEIVKLTKGKSHITTGMSKAELRKFSDSMLAKISAVESFNPLIDFSEERRYFEGLK
jgi:hypothetical protein